MALSVARFLKLDQKQLQKLAGVQKCKSCGVPLQETITGARKTAKGYVCSDCYFKEFSEEVERHPICVPRMHRG